MIRGWDHITPQRCSLEQVLQEISNRWPKAVFLYHPSQGELFAYKDMEAKTDWDQNGPTENNDSTMMMVIFREEETTLVSGLNEKTRAFARSIVSSLKVSNLKARLKDKSRGRSTPQRQPRYDEVYAEGVAWLDSLVGGGLKATGYRDSNEVLIERFKQLDPQLGDILVENDGTRHLVMDIDPPRIKHGGDYGDKIVPPTIWVLEEGRAVVIASGGGVAQVPILTELYIGSLEEFFERYEVLPSPLRPPGAK